MKRLPLIFFLMGVFILKNQYLKAEELLVVRINANYAPYEMVVDGKLTGLHIDLMFSVAKRSIEFYICS